MQVTNQVGIKLRFWETTADQEGGPLSRKVSSAHLPGDHFPSWTCMLGSQGTAQTSWASTLRSFNHHLSVRGANTTVSCWWEADVESTSQTHPPTGKSPERQGCIYFGLGSQASSSIRFNEGPLAPEQHWTSMIKAALWSLFASLYLSTEYTGGTGAKEWTLQAAITNEPTSPPTWLRGTDAQYSLCLKNAVS